MSGLERVDGEHVRLPKLLQSESLNDVTQLFGTVLVAQLHDLQAHKRMKLEDRVTVLARLTKAYSDLIKTHQSINHQDGRTTVRAGVIIVPGKSSDWVAEAKAELDSAKAAIEGA